MCVPAINGAVDQICREQPAVTRGRTMTPSTHGVGVNVRVAGAAVLKLRGLNVQTVAVIVSEAHSLVRHGPLTMAPKLRSRSYHVDKQWPG